MRSTLSKRLASVIADSGKAQVDFATSVGCERKSVIYWLNGRCEPNLRALRRICRTYGVSADWLLGLDETNDMDTSDRPRC